MKLIRFLPFTAALALFAAPAAAQSDYRFVAGSSVYAFGGAVGTYRAELDGSMIDVWCVDFVNHVSVGDTYRVYVTSLAGDPDLSRTRFGTYSYEPQRYQMAAWLAAQFYVQPTSSWASIQAAIWHLTTPGAPGVGFPQNIEVGSWLAQAGSNYQFYYYDNVSILTDVAVAQCAAANPGAAPWNGCGHQEHITISGGRLTMTPEPASMILLASGLVGLGAVGAVRRRKQLQSKD